MIPHASEPTPKARRWVGGAKGEGVLAEAVGSQFLGTPKYTQAHFTDFKGFVFCIFFFFLSSLVPDGGLSTAPSRFCYSSERRSILSSSTSNTRVAPPAGEKKGQNENQDYRETRWVQDPGGQGGILPGIFGGAPRSPYPVKDAQRNSEV